MSVIEELFSVATKLTERSDLIRDKDFNDPLDKLEKAANEIGKTWSGSWLGYHSLVYYENFAEPPTGARFSQEWGLMDQFIRYTVGKWVEYTFQDVVNVINQLAGNPDVAQQKKKATEAQEFFEEAKYTILSCFSRISELTANDIFIKELREKADKQKTLCENDFIRYCRPSSGGMTRDTTALGQGLKTPPHISVLANVHALRQPLIACGELSKIARRVASHLSNQEGTSTKEQRVVTNDSVKAKSSIIWRCIKGLLYLIGVFAALLTILYYLGYLEQFKELVQKKPPTP